MRLLGVLAAAAWLRLDAAATAIAAAVRTRLDAAAYGLVGSAARFDRGGVAAAAAGIKGRRDQGAKDPWCLTVRATFQGLVDMNI